MYRDADAEGDIALAHDDTFSPTSLLTRYVQVKCRIQTQRAHEGYINTRNVGGAGC